jgi:Na+-translocating ferredoxin:NAD+ oxidoreductase RnfE subunit
VINGILRFLFEYSIARREELLQIKLCTIEIELKLIMNESFLGCFRALVLRGTVIPKVNFAYRSASIWWRAVLYGASSVVHHTEHILSLIKTVTKTQRITHTGHSLSKLLPPGVFTHQRFSLHTVLHVKEI